MSRHIPVRDPVRAVCEILGYDAMFLACEGRVVAVVEAAQAEAALAAWRALPGGEQAALIGHVELGRCTGGAGNRTRRPAFARRAGR